MSTHQWRTLGPSGRANVIAKSKKTSTNSNDVITSGPLAGKTKQWVRDHPGAAGQLVDSYNSRSKGKSTRRRARRRSARSTASTRSRPRAQPRSRRRPERTGRVRAGRQDHDPQGRQQEARHHRRSRLGAAQRRDVERADSCRARDPSLRPHHARHGRPLAQGRLQRRHARLQDRTGEKAAARATKRLGPAADRRQRGRRRWALRAPATSRRSFAAARRACSARRASRPRRGRSSRRRPPRARTPRSAVVPLVPCRSPLPEAGREARSGAAPDSHAAALRAGPAGRLRQPGQGGREDGEPPASAGDAGPGGREDRRGVRPQPSLGAVQRRRGQARRAEDRQARRRRRGQPLLRQAEARRTAGPPSSRRPVLRQGRQQVPAVGQVEAGKLETEAIQAPALKVLDQTTRPLHGVMASTRAGIKAHGGGLQGLVKSQVSVNAPNSKAAKAQRHAFQRGIELKDRSTGSDVLKDVGVKNKAPPLRRRVRARRGRRPAHVRHRRDRQHRRSRRSEGGHARGTAGAEARTRRRSRQAAGRDRGQAGGEGGAEGPRGDAQARRTEVPGVRRATGWSPEALARRHARSSAIGSPPTSRPPRATSCARWLRAFARPASPTSR
jgi:hypothetical protein